MFLSLVYPYLFLYISFLILIDVYLFISPNSQLYLSNPFSLSQSILCISTYIFFYLSSIHFVFLISLCQSRLMPISFNPILFISAQFSSIHLYLFLSLLYPPLPLSIFWLSKFKYISFNSLLLILAYHYRFLSIAYLFANPSSRLFLSIPIRPRSYIF